MISLTRKQVRSLRGVIRRALGTNGSRAPVPVSLTTGPQGLHIRAANQLAVVEYRKAGDLPADAITLRLSALADFEGRRDEPVTLERGGDGQVTASWRDGNVPQLCQFESLDDTPSTDCPRVPDQLAEHGPQLLTALRDAIDTADNEAVRYATNAVQLCGDTGRIMATDGRQMLVQAGFELPWEGQVLVRRNTVLAARELACDSVRIGKSDNWLTLVAGPWTLHLALLLEGRFPELERHLPDPASAQTSLDLSGTDRNFLLQTLKRLPGGDRDTQPVTLDLNGSVVVRARGEGQPHATELLLRESQASGRAVRIQTNRQYLERAARLGFRRLHVFQRESPVLCQDNQRNYVWAVLAADEALPPDPEALRIESPASESRPDHQSKTSKRKEGPPSMPTKRNRPRHDTASNGANATNGSAGRSDAAEKSPNTEDVLTQAQAFRQTLREAGRQASELINAIKRDRKHSRAIRATLVSLRQLQNVSI